MKNYLLLAFVSLMMLSCARVGSPVGGKKDTLAPKFLNSNLDSSRVRVPLDTKELRLYFDEYVTLKDISKNLIISPPITKIKKILPSTLGNKYVLIQWQDTLQANTTYNFNFGNAIADLNEGNVLPYFNFAFSTGDQLDNTYLSGEVLPGLFTTRDTAGKPVLDDKKNYVVGLYKDSPAINYREKPYYITKADPDGYFELNYLSPGSYRILAFEDENQNSVYDQGKEAVGFLADKIDLSKSVSGLKIKVFPAKKRPKYVETKEMPGGVLMLFEGQPTTVEIRPAENKPAEFKLSHKAYSDSVRVWFDAAKENIGQTQSENLKFAYTADTLKGTASVFYRFNNKNEMTLSNSEATLAPNTELVLRSNYEIDTISPEKWQLKKDSTIQNFTARISPTNPMELRVSAAFEQNKNYTLLVPKGSVSSYYASLPKSYQFNFNIDKEENFGSLTVNLSDAPKHKFWLQLLDDKGDVKYSKLSEAESKTVKISEIKPAKYSLRILVDNNDNGQWDSSDFASAKFAEDVFIFNKTLEIRALWENVESWNLGQSDVEDAK